MLNTLEAQINNNMSVATYRMCERELLLATTNETVICFVAKKYMNEFCEFIDVCCSWSMGNQNIHIYINESTYIGLEYGNAVTLHEYICLGRMGNVSLHGHYDI